MEWRPIKVHFEVSDTGLIRNIKTGTLYKQHSDKDGYLKVGFLFPVHRLVAEAFLDNSEMNFPVVDHKDGNRQNNNVENLEWVTIGENTRRGWANGRSSVPQRGERNPHHKLTEKQVAQIRMEYFAGGISQRALSKKHGVSKGVMGRILLGKAWAHLLNKRK